MPNAGALTRRLCCLLLTAWAACSASAQEASPRTFDPGQLRQQLWNLINTGDTRRFQTPGILARAPFYRQTSGARPPWHLFPAAGEQTPDAFLNRRLGLPVHGRWISSYVNTPAFNCIKNNVGCSPATGPQQIRLAPGTIVVKENYPNVSTPETVAQRATPGVITVLWKPFADYCGTRLPFNAPRRERPEGPNCLGGEWLYAFFILQSPHLDEAAVRRFDGFVTADNNSQGFCINCHAPASRADYLRGLLAQWRQPVSPAPQEDVVAAAELAGEPFCDGALTLSPELPSDVALDPLSIPSAQLRQRMFDCFSWRSFVALNWPGGWDRRGQPDRRRSFGDFAGPEEPAVWQTYRATWEVFQPERGPGWVPPRQFNGPRPAPKGENCPADAAGLLTVTRPVLTMIAKSRVGDRGVGNETGQAFAGQFGTLADLNGKLVRYEVSMNAAEFAYLVDNGYAGNSSLTPAGPRGVDASFPNGAVEIKAAWKELCVDRGCVVRDDPARYFTRPVLIYDEGRGACEPAPRLMGLVGLHVAQKTQHAPQWIWSTFEQIDNVPRLAGDQVDPALASASARFNDSSCKQQDDFCFWRPFLAGVGLNPSACCPNVTLNRFPGFGFFRPDGRPTPNQLTRLDPIQGSGLNQRFQQLFAGPALRNTPFRYYALVNTQWPLNGRDGAGRPNARRCANASTDGERPQAVGANCYTLVPEDVRNSVVESYMTDYYNDRLGRPVQRSNRSCMGCHGDAGADFSYIFLDAVEQRVPIQGPVTQPPTP